MGALKTRMRTGALAGLLMIAMPVALALSRNALLIFPLWWAIAYWGFRWSFPEEKQASVPALAVLVGNLAWLVRLVIFSSATSVGLNAHAGLLAAGLFWLFVTQSAASAVALIILELVVILTGVYRVLSLDTSWFSGREALVAFAGALLTSGLGHVFALYFLTVFVVNKRQPLSQKQLDR